MKMASGNKNTIASQGVKGSSGFAISNSAHMFSILSDGLYSDKVSAVLREIGANAMDAHIMVGKRDLPFEVKLPSRLDSTFHVKDFGPGLDDQEVRELYTTYGWSSKQNSNEVTGAFGLGSKSPFAYTDSFSICSVKDGVKRVYTAHKDDEGKPVVSLLSEVPSDDDWKAGIMVTFAVAPEDVAEFVQKAGLVFRWFKVKPNVLGAKVDLAEPSFHTRGINFAIGAVEHVDRTARVVMANVAYPLNASRLDGLDAVSLAILSCNVHLFLPTGSVMPTPNREDIQYDKNSRPVIAAALKGAAVEVAKEIYERVNEQKSTPWVWHRRIREYADRLPSQITLNIKKFLELVSSDPVELDSLIKLFNESTCSLPSWVGDSRDAPRVPFKTDATTGAIERNEVGAAVYDHDNYDARGCRVWYYRVDSTSRGSNPVKRKEVVKGGVRLTSRSDPVPVSLSYTHDVTVIVSDAARADMRVKWLLDTAAEKNSKIILVQPVRGADVAFATAYANSLAGDSSQGLGGVPVKMVSTIELPKEVIEERKSVRLTVVQKREAFLENHLTYFSLTDGSTPVQTAFVSDFAEESDKFFVVLRESNGNALYGNTTNAELRYKTAYSLEALTEIVQGVAQLRETEAFEGLTGFFAVRSEQLRRLSLSEDGWAPALPALSKQCADKAWLGRLSQHVDASPELHLGDLWQAKQAGFAGVLALHAKNSSSFFGQLRRLMPEHPMIRLAQRLADNAVSAAGGRSSVGVEALITKVNQHLEYSARLDLPGLTRLKANEVHQMVMAVYPSLTLLDFAHWVQATDATPDLAASLFWQFVHLKAEGDAQQAGLLSKLGM